MSARAAGGLQAGSFSQGGVGTSAGGSAAGERKRQNCQRPESPEPRKAKGGLLLLALLLFILLGPRSRLREKKRGGAHDTREEPLYLLWVCQTTSPRQGNTLFASRILRSVTHAMNPWALACTGSTPTSTQKTISTRTVKNRCITQRHLPACLAPG